MVLLKNTGCRGVGETANIYLRCVIDVRQKNLGAGDSGVWEAHQVNVRNVNRRPTKRRNGGEKKEKGGTKCKTTTTFENWGARFFFLERFDFKGGGGGGWVEKQLIWPKSHQNKSQTRKKKTKRSQSEEGARRVGGTEKHTNM